MAKNDARPAKTANADQASSRNRIPFEARLFNYFTIILFVVILMQVFSRWVLNRSLPWTEEFSRYFFIWGSYFAVSVGVYHGRHMRIAAHIMLLPLRVRRIILTVADSIWIGFNCVVIYNSILFNLSMVRYPLYSGTTRFNLVWVYTIIPLAFTLMTVRILRNVIARFTAGGSGSRVEKEY